MKLLIIHPSSQILTLVILTVLIIIAITKILLNQIYIIKTLKETNPMSNTRFMNLPFVALFMMIEDILFLLKRKILSINQAPSTLKRCTCDKYTVINVPLQLCLYIYLF